MRNGLKLQYNNAYRMPSGEYVILAAMKNVQQDCSSCDRVLSKKQSELQSPSLEERFPLSSKQANKQETKRGVQNTQQCSKVSLRCRRTQWFVNELSIDFVRLCIFFFLNFGWENESKSEGKKDQKASKKESQFLVKLTRRSLLS